MESHKIHVPNPQPAIKHLQYQRNRSFCACTESGVGSPEVRHGTSEAAMLETAAFTSKSVILCPKIGIEWNQILVFPPSHFSFTILLLVIGYLVKKCTKLGK
jgi:hypothetical protein